MAESEFENEQTEQFRRYFHQEMTPGEQHGFEKRLLSDPLFSEAYEGYATMTTDEVSFPKDLGKMLAERIERRNKMLPLWRYAAAAVVILGAGWLGFLSYDRPGGKESAVLDNVIDRQKVASPYEANGKAVVDSAALPAAGSKYLSKEILADADDLTPKIADASAPGIDSVSLKQAPIHKGERIAQADQTSDYQGLRILREEIFTAEDSFKRENADTSLKPSLAITRPRSAPAQQGLMIRGTSSLGNQGLEKLLSDTNSVNKLTRVFPDSVVFGRIVDAAGQPIPGATAKIPGKSQAVTDSGGYFLMLKSGRDSLSVSMIGYNTKKLATNGANLGAITLNEDRHALSEVVVVGYGQAVAGLKVKRSRGVGLSKEAIPAIGWESYNSYILENSDIQELAGQLTISFTVQSDGTLRGFRGKGKNNVVEEAILRIKNGPKWQAATKNGLFVASRVSVTFGKKN